MNIKDDNLIRHVLNATKDLIFYKDLNFIYIGCNEAFANFVGKTQSEIIGKSDYDLFSKEYADLFRKMDKEMLKKGDTNSNYEWVMYPDNKKVYLLTQKSPLKDENGNIIGIVGFARDMTKQKALEDKLKELNQNLNLKYKSIFDYSSIGILILNIDGVIVESNYAFANIVDYSKNELQNKKLIDVIGSNCITNLTYFQNMIDGDLDFYQIEKALLKKDGSSVDVNLTFSLIKDLDKPKYVLVMVEDISKKKAIENEQKTQKSMLIQQSKMASVGEMIGAIAHQWKQPLNALSLTVEALEDMVEYEELNEEYLKDFIRNSMKQIDFMATTVDDFRNFFKPSKERVIFQLKETIEDTTKLLIQQFKNHNIEVNIKGSSKIKSYGAPNEFKQVVLNILNNAKDAIEERREVEKIKYFELAGKINIKVEKDNDFGVVTIKDNGIGISDEIKKNLFKPYITTKGEAGTGIGLYMSKTIIENLDGELKIGETKKGKKGAVFVINLPLSN